MINSMHPETQCRTRKNSQVIHNSENRVFFMNVHVDYPSFFVRKSEPNFNNKESQKGEGFAQDGRPLKGSRSGASANVFGPTVQHGKVEVVHANPYPNNSSPNYPCPRPVPVSLPGSRRAPPPRLEKNPDLLIWVFPGVLENLLVVHQGPSRNLPVPIQSSLPSIESRRPGTY